MYPFSFCGYFKIRNQKIKTLTNSGRHLVLRFLQLAIWRCMWQWLEVTEAVELTAVQAGAELFPTSSAIFRPGLRMLYRDHKEFQDIRTWRSTRISQALGRFPYDLPSSSGTEDQQEFRKHWDDFHTVSHSFGNSFFSVSCLKLLRLSPVFHFLCQLSNAGFVKITGCEKHWISHRIINGKVKFFTISLGGLVIVAPINQQLLRIRLDYFSFRD